MSKGRTFLHSGTSVSVKDVIAVTLDCKKRQLIVKWNDEDETRYPYIWLQNNCQCAACFNQTVLARTSLFGDLFKDKSPVSVELNKFEQRVLINWTDGHHAEYPYEWLRSRSFRQKEQLLRGKWLRRSQKLWNASDLKTVPAFNYTELINDDSTLYQWLTTLEETGITLIDGAFIEADQEKIVSNIAYRVGYTKRNPYGDVFCVRNMVKPTNVAYSDVKLELHTDFSFSYDTPGLQLLGCYADSSVGGESQFVDGFKVAEQLRKLQPDHFNLLSTKPVYFFDEGKDMLDFHIMAQQKILQLDESGNVKKVVFSNHTFDSFIPVSLEDVEPLYNAMKSIYSLFNDPNNFIQFKLKPGQVVCFDNYRILHGRTQISDLKGHERVLYGCYIGWEEAHSKRRVLKEILNITDEEY